MTVVHGLRGKKDPVRLDLPNFSYYAEAPLPAPPNQAHYGGKVPTSQPWGMYGNDQWGDCVLAAIAHKSICDDFDEFSQKLPIPDEAMVVAEYHKLSPDDEGLVMSSAMQLWCKPGLPFNADFSLQTAVAFAPFNANNMSELSQGLAFYGGVLLGVQLPQSAEQQFDEDKAWTVVSDSPILGGHAIFLCGYDKEWVYLVTWGKLIAASWAFIQDYADEGYVIVDEQMEKAGYGPTKLKVAELKSDINKL